MAIDREFNEEQWIDLTRDAKRAEKFVQGEITLEQYLKPEAILSVFREIVAPKHHQITDLRIIESVKGFYIGRLQYDASKDTWGTFDRFTGYSKSRLAAELVLEQMLEFKEAIKGISRANLKVLSEDLFEKEDDDASYWWKKEIINKIFLRGYKYGV